MPKKLIVGLLLITFVMLLWVYLPKLPAVLGVSSINNLATSANDWTSDVKAWNIGPYSAEIGWLTDSNTSSWVKYWKRDSQSARFTGQNDNTRGHTVRLSGLVPNTTYDYVISRTADGQTPFPYSTQHSFTTLPDPRITTNTLPRTIVSPDSLVTDGVPITTDLNTLPPSPKTLVPVLPPLKIENIRYSDVTSTSVTIYWTTNNKSNSYVQYYTNPLKTSVAGRNESVTDHKVALSKLAPDTKYSYRVKSKDSGGQEQTSGVNYFTTLKLQTTAGSAPQGSTQTPADENIPADNQNQPSDESVSLDEPADNDQLSNQSGITYDMSTEPDDIGFDAPPVEDSPSQTDNKTNLPNTVLEEPNEVLEALNKSVLDPIAKVVESSPINPLFKSSTFQKTPFFVYILTVPVIFFLIKRIFFPSNKKTSNEDSKSSDKVHQKSFAFNIRHNLAYISSRLPGIFRKKIFLIGLGIVIIFFVLTQLIFLPLLLTPDTSNNQETSKSPDYYTEYLNYFTKIDYQDPPQKVASASFDCQKYPLLPDKNKNYLCKNIYQTDENKLKDEVTAQKSDRIFLYGQNIYFDCPAQSSKAKDPITECYQSAKFIDIWQIRKMQEMSGVQFPSKKLYYHLTETPAQTKKLCGKIGSVNETVGACLDPKTNSIFTPAYNSNGSMYLGLVSALFFESSSENAPAAKYKGQVFLPRNCYLTDNHEIIHVLNAAVWENMPTWLDEGLVKLLQNTIRKETCPPGIKVAQLVKINGNQEIPVNETFDPDSLDWEEPLSKGLTELSEDSSCRKGILLEIAKNIRDGGPVYLKSLYKTLDEKSATDDNAIAGKIWQSTKQDSIVKESLIKHKCSF